MHNMRPAKGAKGTKADEIEMPLADAGATKADVLAYWKSSPFDLQLDPAGDLGNCTLCFMKARAKVVSAMRATSFETIPASISSFERPAISARSCTWKSRSPSSSRSRSRSPAR